MLQISSFFKIFAVHLPDISSPGHSKWMKINSWLGDLKNISTPVFLEKMLFTDWTVVGN